MTKDEVIEYMLQHNKILEIDGEYFIPDDSVQKPSLKKSISKPTSILKKQILSKSWPESISDSKNNYRVIALMDECRIPAKSPQGNMLRSITSSLTREINNIVENGEVEGSLFITAISDYYATTSYPKSFKNLVTEGDAMVIYKEWYEYNKSLNQQKKPGSLKDDSELDPNERWQ